MLLQPLVENAIHHGIAPKVSSSSLVIRVERREDALHFEIRDTGRGMEEGLDFWKKGLGLSHTRERLRSLSQTELRVAANTPSGLIVSFSL